MTDPIEPADLIEPSQPPAVTELPQAPIRGGDGVFRIVSETFVVALSPFRSGLVALGQNIFINAGRAHKAALAAFQWASDAAEKVGICQEKVENCQGQVSAATAQADRAAANADRAESVIDAEAYTAGKIGGYGIEDRVYSPVTGGLYASKIVQAEGSVEPLSNLDAWRPLFPKVNPITDPLTRFARR